MWEQNICMHSYIFKCKQKIVKVTNGEAKTMFDKNKLAYKLGYKLAYKIVHVWMDHKLAYWNAT